MPWIFVHGLYLLAESDFERVFMGSLPSLTNIPRVTGSMAHASKPYLIAPLKMKPRLDLFFVWRIFYCPVRMNGIFGFQILFSTGTKQLRIVIRWIRIKPFQILTILMKSILLKISYSDFFIYRKIN